MPSSLLPGRLFCFGLGYSARVLARRLLAAGWQVAGTAQEAATCAALSGEGVGAYPFTSGRPLPDPTAALADVTHVLCSIPPDPAGDPTLIHHRADLIAQPKLQWIGYLSTTGVYGDTAGAMVDENSPLHPTSARSRERVHAEDAWLALYREHHLPVHVFRLAGIYGPGRSALDQVRAGSARRIDRPGHKFSRIHVEDIAEALLASMASPKPGAIYNVCDDEPAEPSRVVEEACRLLDVAPPPLVPFEQAATNMSPMALSFWRDNRLVSNRRLRGELGVRLRYPSYRLGLRAVLDAGG